MVCQKVANDFEVMKQAVKNRLKERRAGLCQGHVIGKKGTVLYRRPRL